MNSFLILLGLCKSSPFIQNIKYPACKNCIHFIPHSTNYPYEDIPNDEQYGRCKKFGDMNLVSGSIGYDYALICRKYEIKCGKNGKFYEEKK